MKSQALADFALVAQQVWPLALALMLGVIAVVGLVSVFMTASSVHNRSGEP